MKNKRRHVVNAQLSMDVSNRMLWARKRQIIMFSCPEEKNISPRFSDAVARLPEGAMVVL
jgi:hypothetical protein